MEETKHYAEYEITEEDRRIREECMFDTCTVCNGDRRYKCRQITEQNSSIVNKK